MRFLKSIQTQDHEKFNFGIKLLIVFSQEDQILRKKLSSD